MVIREDRMAEGLAYLAAELGLADAPPAPLDNAAAQALDAIWEPSLEDAAQDAYNRDYMGFGFGAWKAKD